MTTLVLIAALVAMAYAFLMNLLLAACKLIDHLTKLLEVFSGIKKVVYGNEDMFLTDVFFNNNAINNVYWGMALVGVAMCFGFAIFAVTRKMFDANGRIQSSIGQIVTDTLKTVFIILSLSAIVTITLTGVNVLLRQINYMFQNAEGLDKAEVVEYTDEQYAAMARALSVIANYNMNPSSDSRYNINDCFNHVRPELLILQQQGVFKYEYPHFEKDAQGNITSQNSWQSVLKEVADSADIRYDLKADVYYPNVARAISNAVEVMQKDASFKPLARFEWSQSAGADEIVLDHIVFLTGTLEAANNASYNLSPSFDDSLRRPYYTGQKSLYDKDGVDAMDQIELDFSESKYNYLVAFVLATAVIYNTVVLILGFVASLFNLMFLYLIAPPVLASRPLDGGAKAKQWTDAFIVQSLSILGTFVAMRLLLIFVPVIYDPKLTLIAGNSDLDYFAKAVMLFAAFEATKKAGGIFSGILTNTAGMASDRAGDMTASAQRAFGAARAYGMGALQRAGGAVGFAAKPLTNRLGKPFQRYAQLGSGPSRKEQESAIEQKAQSKLAVQKRFMELGGVVAGGGGGGGVTGGSGGDAPRSGGDPGGGGGGSPAEALRAAFSKPDFATVQDGSGPRDMPRKSASVMDRVADIAERGEMAREQFRQQNESGEKPVQSPGQLSGRIPAAPSLKLAQRVGEIASGRDAAARTAQRSPRPDVKAPEQGGDIPRPPQMPQGGGPTVAQRAERIERGRNAENATAQRRMETAEKPIAPEGGDIPRPPQMPQGGGPTVAQRAERIERGRNAENATARRRTENAERPAAPEGGHIPQAPPMPQGGKRQQEMDAYMMNRFLRDRFSGGDQS